AGVAGQVAGGTKQPPAVPGRGVQRGRRRAVAEVLHHVHLAARRPAVLPVVAPHQPERRPQPAPRVHLDPGLDDPAELPELVPRGDPRAAIDVARAGPALPGRPDDQMRAAVLEGVDGGIGVLLELAVPPAAVAQVIRPPGRVRRCAGRPVELVAEAVAGPAAPTPEAPQGDCRSIVLTRWPVTTIRQG